MKIALVYDAIYPYTIGGGEKRNWEIARGLASRGHDVWILGMQFWPGAAHFQADGVHLFGVCPRVHRFNPQGRRTFFQPWIFAWGLYRHLRTQSYEVIDCSNFPYLSCLVIRWLTWPRRPSLTINWFEARGWQGWWRYQGWRGLPAAVLEWACTFLTPHNTSISALTIEQAEERLPQLRGRIELLSCGVDETAWARYRDLPKIKQILYAGRLVRHKRVDLLIEAFSQFVKKFPDYRLKIIGRGDQRKALAEQVQHAGIAAQTDFLEPLAETEVAREFSVSQLFVMPSEQEGFGLVIVEAMAAGTPVVALDAPSSAARFLIQHRQNGWLGREAGALAQGLEELCANPTLYAKVRTAGFKTAHDYDWNSVIVPEAEKHYRQVQATAAS
jgi:glycosyltransferase involved in cell wall biosynthesis